MSHARLEKISLSDEGDGLFWHIRIQCCVGALASVKDEAHVLAAQVGINQEVVINYYD